MLKNPKHQNPPKKMSKDEQEQSNNTNNNSESNDDNSSSSSEQQTPEIKSTSRNDYEKQREARISANNARMEALGLRNMANILMGTPPNRQRGRISNRNPKRVGKNKRDSDDDEYEPEVDGIDVGVSSGDGDDDDDDEDGDFEEEDETFVRRIRKSSAKKAKNIKSKSGKQVSMTDPTDIPVFMDEDEALKQAISLSLKDIGEISLQQNSMSSQNLSTRNASGKEKSRDHIQEDNTKRRKRKLFTSRVQMTEDDLVIHFCQFDGEEVGKGSISLRDVERMAATHDFAWTDKELSDMVRCFDSDRDGKLTLDDFRNIVQRCNMLESQEDF